MHNTGPRKQAQKAQGEAAPRGQKSGGGMHVQFLWHRMVEAINVRVGGARESTPLAVAREVVGTYSLNPKPFSLNS